MQDHNAAVVAGVREDDGLTIPVPFVSAPVRLPPKKKKKQPTITTFLIFLVIASLVFYLELQMLWKAMVGPT